MKLTYRGANYEYNPLNCELPATEMSGKYRGVAWKRDYPRHIPHTQPVAELKYRGVGYYVGDPLDVELMRLSKEHTNSASETQPCKIKKFGDELGRTHLANIRRNLEHRLEVAREKGDCNLVRLLEEEVKQLA